MHLTSLLDLDLKRRMLLALAFTNRAASHRSRTHTTVQQQRVSLVTNLGYRVQ